MHYSKISDKELLKKMIEATTLHIKRLMDEGNIERVVDLQIDLVGLRLRLEELEKENG